MGGHCAGYLKRSDTSTLPCPPPPTHTHPYLSLAPTPPVPAEWRSHHQAESAVPAIVAATSRHARTRARTHARTSTPTRPAPAFLVFHVGPACSSRNRQDCQGSAQRPFRRCALRDRQWHIVQPSPMVDPFCTVSLPSARSRFRSSCSAPFLAFCGFLNRQAAVLCRTPVVPVQYHHGQAELPWAESGCGIRPPAHSPLSARRAPGRSEHA